MTVAVIVARKCGWSLLKHGEMCVWIEYENAKKHTQTRKRTQMTRKYDFDARRREFISCTFGVANMCEIFVYGSVGVRASFLFRSFMWHFCRCHPFRYINESWMQFRENGAFVECVYAWTIQIAGIFDRKLPFHRLCKWHRQFLWKV